MRRPRKVCPLIICIPPACMSAALCASHHNQLSTTARVTHVYCPSLMTLCITSQVLGHGSSACSLPVSSYGTLCGRLRCRLSRRSGGSRYAILSHTLMLFRACTIDVSCKCIGIHVVPHCPCVSCSDSPSSLYYHSTTSIVYTQPTDRFSTLTGRSSSSATSTGFGPHVDASIRCVHMCVAASM